MKHERVVDPFPEETVPAPTPALVRWNVYNASGVLTAVYGTEAEAAAHCLSWASGMTYRAT